MVRENASMRETRKEDVLVFLDSLRKTVVDDTTRVMEAEVKFGSRLEELPLLPFPVLLPRDGLTITIKVNGGA